MWWGVVWGIRLGLGELRFSVTGVSGMGRIVQSVLTVAKQKTLCFDIGYSALALLV